MSAHYRARRTLWLHLETGAGVADTGALVRVMPAAPAGMMCGRDGGGVLYDAAEQLAALLAGLPAGCERVYLTDAAPWSQWFTLAPPAPWIVSARGHHPDDATPALRYRQPLTGRDVEIRAASEWFAGEVTPAQCRDAAELLTARLRRARAVRGAGDEWAGAIMLASPSTTGRYLLELLGTLPAALDDDDAELWRSATFGGRMHLAPAPTKGAKVPALAYYDARVAYGALAQMELGVGPAQRWTPARAGDLPLDDRGNLSVRGLLSITTRVPYGWDRVGLLPVRRSGATDYPNTPGEIIQGWYDTAEVALARSHGWPIIADDGRLLTQGAPLKGWATTLETLWRQLGESEDVPERVRELARGAVRAIVLKTIGALHSDTYRSRRIFAEAADVPAGAMFYRTDSGAFVVEQHDQAGRVAHPELTAQIWARGRVRLLDAPSGTTGVRVGALHVEPQELVALRTDAVYLTRPAPAWHDTSGKWGRYRLKGAISRPRTWPTSSTRLLKLRVEAEANQP